MGDQHPWTVGFENTDFRDYRAMISRFPNEGGILGPTALPTVLACLPGKTPDSRLDLAGDPALQLAWDHHDNGIAAWGEVIYPDRMLRQWLNRDITQMTVADWVYWGGVVQGEGLTEYIRNFRRRMFSSASAIFWMYNDCWPCVRSWTVVDYYLRRTPAFHPVRRACRPLTVALAVEDDKVRVFGVNEGPAWAGEVRYGLFALTGGYPLDESRVVALPANASTLLAEFDAAVWEKLGHTTHGAFAILSANGAEVARDRLFMPYFKEMHWPDAEVTVRRAGGKAIFESAVFAWRVCLDLDGDDLLPDNFFDILPGVPTVLDWPEALGEPLVLRVGNG
jgi:beta-mannosidase